MARISETIVGYVPDLSILRAMIPRSDEPEGTVVSPILERNTIRFDVKLPAFPGTTIVTWNVDADSTEVRTVTISTHVIAPADLVQAYAAITLLKNRIAR